MNDERRLEEEADPESDTKGLFGAEAGRGAEMLSLRILFLSSVLGCVSELVSCSRIELPRVD
jgi:hypothetical protein